MELKVWGTARTGLCHLSSGVEKFQNMYGMNYELYRISTFQVFNQIELYGHTTWTDASGTSMQGVMRRGLLDRSSTSSAAVGRCVGVLFQQDFSRVSLQMKQSCIQ